MKAIAFRVVRDITPSGWSAFIRHRTRIDYDAYTPRAKKRHQLVYQQGDVYGTVGDKCLYLTHDELLALLRDGAIDQIAGKLVR
jgi:hypothetical protein